MSDSREDAHRKANEEWSGKWGQRASQKADDAKVLEALVALVSACENPRESGNSNATVCAYSRSSKKPKHIEID
jgi:hypothetical protein